MLDDLAPDITKAARSVAIQWPGVVLAEDVEQDLYVQLLARPGSLDKIRRMDELGRYKSILWMGHQIASQERKEYDHFAGNYRYSVQEVKAMLKDGALRWLEADPPTQRPPDEEFFGFKVRGPHTPVKAPIVDLRKGMSLLAQRHLRYAEAISKRYLFEEYPEHGKDSTALHRAVCALTEEMNRAHRTAYAERDDGPGTRHPITNREAVAVSHGQWDSKNMDYDEKDKELWERPKYYGV